MSIVVVIAIISVITNITIVSNVFGVAMLTNITIVLVGWLIPPIVIDKKKVIYCPNDIFDIKK